ncbi:unnamed protein product [Brassica rapa subsp. narinosa]
MITHTLYPSLHRLNLLNNRSSRYQCHSCWVTKSAAATVCISTPAFGAIAATIMASVSVASAEILPPPPQDGETLSNVPEMFLVKTARNRGYNDPYPKTQRSE